MTKNRINRVAGLGSLLAVFSTIACGGSGTTHTTSSDEGPATSMVAPAALPARGTTTELAETPEQREQRMKWWREAKFGMFIHWGVYAVPAGTYKDKQIGGIGEWIMLRGKIPVADYQAYAKEFNPVKYDPDAWAQLAQDAGMKYIVITSKHHDGFALFPTAASKWNVVDATPYGKDLIGPLADAAKKRGIRFGLYYSQAQDWNNGGAPSGDKRWDTAQNVRTMDEYIDQVAVPQVREILTKYDPAVLWWDTPSEMNKERADKLRALIALSPGIITNNRLGGGYKGDTETPEQKIPATGFKDRDWETCMTMNGTWGFKSYDHNWKSTDDLIKKLCDIASKGGNFLLNVGPTAEGLIPQESIDRLREMGEWMKVNGESIYATTASPFEKLAFGRCTKRVEGDTTTLYLHVFDWPKDGKLVLPGLKNEVTSASLLAGGDALKTERRGGDVVVSVPEKPTDPIVSVVKITIPGTPDITPPPSTQPASGPAGGK